MNRIKQSHIMTLAVKRLERKHKPQSLDEAGLLFWLGAVCVCGLLSIAVNDVAIRVVLALAEVP